MPTFEYPQVIPGAEQPLAYERFYRPFLPRARRVIALIYI